MGSQRVRHDWVTFTFFPTVRPRESQGPGFLGKSVYCTRECEWHLTPVLLPGKSHGQRSLVGCSPWGRKESDTTEWLHFHFSLSCIGEGNGNPLQCSCLENPRDGRAWWAAIYGVAQSRTRLKRLSSSSSSSRNSIILARKIPQTEEPGGLQSMGSQRVRHNSNWACKRTHLQKLGGGSPIHLMLTFQRNGSQVLEKDIPGLWT